jgi:MYXO-CTERM domain-containing protein
VARRWYRSLDPEHVDRAVAALLLVALELQIWTGPPHGDRTVAAIAAIVLCAAVAVRRRRLVEALALALVATTLKLAIWGTGARAGGGGGAGLIAVMLLFYAAGAFYTGRRSWLAAGLGVATVVIANLGASGPLVSNLVFGAAVVVAPAFLVGRMARDHAARERASRARAEHLDAQRELRVRAAGLAERTRLAREIHDVIAHSVSVMVIQAAGARTVMAGDPERAEESLRAVERAGREALAELRRLLGVLGDGRSLRELAPQPGLNDLDELVARTTASGVTVSMQVEGRPLAVPPGLSLCAYRVVQEALTNTIKHAGPARASVALRWGTDELLLVVADDGAGELGLSPVPAGGHGIAGMRERVALHGGTVVAGPAPGGGFAVHASLPLTAEALL